MHHHLAIVGFKVMSSIEIVKAVTDRKYDEIKLYVFERAVFQIESSGFFHNQDFAKLEKYFSVGFMVNDTKSLGAAILSGSNNKNYRINDDYYRTLHKIEIQLNIDLILDRNEKDLSKEFIDKVIDHESSHIIQYLSKMKLVDDIYYYCIIQGQKKADYGHNKQFRDIMVSLGYTRKEASAKQVTPMCFENLSEEQIYEIKMKCIVDQVKNDYIPVVCGCGVSVQPKKNKAIIARNNYYCDSCDSQIKQFHLRSNENKFIFEKYVKKIINIDLVMESIVLPSS